MNFLFPFILMAVPNSFSMHSLPQEQLKPAIKLSCPGFSILEWEKVNSQDQEKIDRIVCYAVKEFSNFLLYQHIVIQDFTPNNWNLIFLPEDNQNRHLNDIKKRFYLRHHWRNDRGEIIPVDGYTSHSLQDIFVEDDIKNFLKFSTILSHEVFHALSWQSGLYQSYSGNKDLVDESMAVKFTLYLNLGV